MRARVNGILVYHRKMPPGLRWSWLGVYLMLREDHDTATSRASICISAQHAGKIIRDQRVKPQQRQSRGGQNAPTQRQSRHPSGPAMNRSTIEQ